jgi:hypothetical protein
VLAHAPHTEVAEIEGPHLALFTNPVQSAARIAGFLRSGETTGWIPRGRIGGQQSRPG